MCLRSRTDYLLGTDHILFKNVAVQDPRHNSYHYMVVGQLQGGTAREHVRYIKGQKRMQLLPPKEPTREDKLFGDLRRAVPKPHEREKHRNAWISDETWRLADERVSARRGTRTRARLRRLGRAVRASLKGDMRRLPPKDPTREDKLFGDLRRAVPKPHEREKHRNAWISDDTWRLADERVSARRGTRVRARLRRLGRAVRARLKGDRRRRVEDAGKDVDALLGEDPPNAKEVWRRMKGWYRAAAYRGPPPARATLEWITAERVELYSQVPSPGDNIPVTM